MPNKSGFLDQFAVAAVGQSILGQPPSGYMPLSFAALRRDIELVQLLINNEAKVNLATVIGNTPLSFAVKKGHVEVVRLLIENGAAVNQATVKGATPLYFAAKLGNNKIVELLLANGADPNKKAEIFRLWRFSFTRSPEAAARRYHGSRETVVMLKAAKAIKKRKIVPSSEHTPLLAGHSASYSAIRQPSIGPAKLL
ncbi:ankyrin repeat domain-containing protein [Thalassotalea sp. G20_0]|uniref:ankyrin repeat domain-containing protein n=1 Tax=Thalassotalea sp. G20_0 TaxID=2821093 RepID=UPI001ADCBF9F|nr:ankyrin repeat domain-containing protein [Thalassotalea sp. G20_0]MBO9493474.1 ankyrin repeat domain-containing protein [Thalassotalea sp. G20_0]